MHMIAPHTFIVLLHLSAMHCMRIAKFGIWINFPLEKIFFSPNLVTQDYVIPRNDKESLD